MRTARAASSSSSCTRQPGRGGRRSGAHDALLVPLLAALPLKQAVALAAEISGAARNVLYARALEMKARSPQNDDAG